MCELRSPQMAIANQLFQNPRLSDADICLTCPTASTSTRDGHPEGCSAAQELAPDVCLLSKIPAHLVILCKSDFFNVQANGQAKEQPQTVTQQEQQEGKEEDEPSPAALEAHHQHQNQQKEEQQRQIPAGQQSQHPAHSHAVQQLQSHQQLATEDSKCMTIFQPGCSRPQLMLHLVQADHEPAVLAVLAALYGVPDALSQLTQQQLVQALVYADRLAVTTAEQEAIKLLRGAVMLEDGLNLDALQELGSMRAWPQCLLPLLPLMITEAQYPAPSADGKSSNPKRAPCLMQILLLVFGDLANVWQQQCLSSLLLDLPLPAMQLLLSSQQLKADSEDNVLYTAQRYLMAQPPDQQEAVRQGLAPLIRCPLLSGLQLAAHSGCTCVTQPHGTLEQMGGVGVFSVLTPLLPKVRKLAQLQRLPRPLPQLLEAIKHHISDAPASWHLGQRPSSSILQPEVSVTWKLPVEKLKAACKECWQLKTSVSLISPDVSAPMGGVAWGLLCKCSWQEDAGGVQVCLYVKAAYYPKAEVAAYHDFEVEIRAFQHHQHFKTADPCLLGSCCGFDDGFGVAVMTGDDGWDESAWVGQGLPVEGELDLQLVRMHWVK